MKQYYYYTVLSNWVRGFDKYQNRYSKELIKESSFPNQFYLLDETQLDIGYQKALKLLKKINKTNDKIIRISTNLDEKNVQNNTKNNKGYFVNSNYIDVYGVDFIENQKVSPVAIEELTAMAYNLEEKNSYKSLKPRTVSYLPIANACQARCWFCFSEYSISIEKENNKVDFVKLEEILIKAKKNGAERFVVTGGGEPGLMPFNELIGVISLAKKYFNKIVLITNGMFLSYKKEENCKKMIEEMIKAGLTVISISKHHYNDETNKQIMGVDTKTTELLKIISSYKKTLQIRLICVLQKNGIKDTESIQNYINYAIEHEVKEICFKELYVASSLESLYSKNKENDYAKNNQVSLNEVIKYCENNNFKKISELPWKSPIFDNGTIKIAAYTEPSVGWELTNGICRSWNVMSDLKNYATLEDLNSLLE